MSWYSVGAKAFIVATTITLCSMGSYEGVRLADYIGMNKTAGGLTGLAVGGLVSLLVKEAVPKRKTTAEIFGCDGGRI